MVWTQMTVERGRKIQMTLEDVWRQDLKEDEIQWQKREWYVDEIPLLLNIELGES